jgi:hypothetical protein
MPCPYFEPQRVVPLSQVGNGRLPLLQEHDGLCRAGPQPFEAPAEMRFRYCNHGYSRGACQHFPSQETRSALRYELKPVTKTELEVMVIEERDYAPGAWRVVRYSTHHEQLEPEIQDPCVRAQILALCRTYLSHFTCSKA